MTTNQHASKLKGVLSPVVTPFTSDYEINHGLLLKHCQWLIEQGVGLAIFGTNSEANSLTVSEKRRMLDGLLANAVPASQMMPGTGACALADAIELSQHATNAGCAGVLMLPPFYYKGVSDEGLYRAYATIIDKVASERLRIYLYHIPQVSGVPITLTLIERLLKAFPETIAGVKDSSGDWANTKAMLDRFQPQGFDVFAGSENFLLANLRAGGVGCITATGNVNPSEIVRLYSTWQAADADAQQAALDVTRAAFAQFNLIASMKAALAWKSGRADWATVRPPLVELDSEQRHLLEATLTKIGFTVPNASSLS